MDTTNRPALALDDNDADLRSLTRSFERLERPFLGVASFGDLVQLLERAVSGPTEELPLYLLLDLSMPDISGAEVLEHLAETVPCLPVVLLTGSRRGEERDEAYRRGASGVVEKPLGLQALHAVVNGIDDYWRFVAQPVGRLR